MIRTANAATAHSVQPDFPSKDSKRDPTAFQKFHLPPEAAEILIECKGARVVNTTEELIDMACGGPTSDCFEVAYSVPGKGLVTEATVARVRNGVVANYIEPYMRRRDPDCLVIGDGLPTDKEGFRN